MHWAVQLLNGTEDGLLNPLNLADFAAAVADYADDDLVPLLLDRWQLGVDQAVELSGYPFLLVVGPGFLLLSKDTS